MILIRRILIRNVCKLDILIIRNENRGEGIPAANRSKLNLGGSNQSGLVSGVVGVSGTVGEDRSEPLQLLASLRLPYPLNDVGRSRNKH